MGLSYEIRESDAPFVERVWRSRSHGLDTLIAIAVAQPDLVVWNDQGKTRVTLQGPETRAWRAPLPDHDDFFGIAFKPGVYLPHLPTGQFVNGDVALPAASSRSFWLQGAAWEIPTYDNAEVFVARLVRAGLLQQEPGVAAALRDEPPALSRRQVQRRFLHATGLTQRVIQQIERARQATVLLQQGTPIAAAAYETGYFDQAHMTHALKHYVGQTPAQILDIHKSEPMSLLYNPDSLS